MHPTRPRRRPSADTGLRVWRLCRRRKLRTPLRRIAAKVLEEGLGADLGEAGRDGGEQALTRLPAGQHKPPPLYLAVNSGAFRQAEYLPDRKIRRTYALQ